VQWFWDIDEDGDWDTDIIGYDYIDILGKGLIRRVIYFNVVNGNLAGADRDECKLLSLSILSSEQPVR